LFQSYRTNLVLLWQTPENDVWNNIFPTHWPVNGTPKPTYWLIGGSLFGPSEHIEQELTSPLYLKRILDNYLKRHLRDDIWEHSYLKDYKAYIPILETESIVNHEWQKRWDANIAYMRQESPATGKCHMAISFTPRSARMLYGLKLTRRLINEIKKVSSENKASFILFNVKKPPKGSSEQPVTIYKLNGKFYKTSILQYEQNLGFIAEGSEYYSIPVTTKNYAVNETDPHLNANANDQVMKDLAGILKKKVALSQN
jgi:hypothetical protein